ncbi:MAG: tRNA (adenosine(37)-N6)-threonylcarbamoyltransferase complex ATPase subunit type 1 TsaE [Phyllobacteriaceae bacterium]|nr:tRNA (adenosine(37)-N6)-threonylcarbamoyltransferase complex ATPase subunit type 1 TsaE [Phyllobacteriaceae bacterium]
MSVFLADEAATARLGEDLSLALKAGDALLLSGELGAGKSALARAVIRSLAGDPELDVPSPTFTLVQAYDGRLPVRHVDLYRISAETELDELGLDEALERGVVIVEWPDRAPAALPADAIRIRLSDEGGRRRPGRVQPEARARIGRSLAIRDFLVSAGHGGGVRAFLLGDASTRAYETLAEGGETLIVMNSPRQPDGPPIRDGLPYSRIAHLAENVTPFVAVARLLSDEGFAAPEIIAADLDRGLLLIEHLGPGGFLDDAGAPVAARYVAAARLLAHLHERRWPRRVEVAPGIVHTIADYDAGAMRIEVELALDWYFPLALGRAADAAERTGFIAAWDALIAEAAGAEQSLVLRDYHSPNLIWRPERQGDDRLGIIDFQDAMIGPAAYDVASLSQDARVTIAPELEQAIVDAYCAERAASGPFDRAAFERAHAIMAAQRNSKILGIFVRLNVRDGKPHYLRHLPRIRAYLRRALAHPALAGLRQVYEQARLVEETI